MIIERDLRLALALARSLGCRVSGVWGTGEMVVSHPAMPRRVRLNGRRKDTPRRLTSLLLALQRRQGGAP